ncbi:TPA: hypothetical protein ACGSTL_001355 [Vibrio parahaemolyticus]|uniref:hypothetical protein n=1 Tax=Vibrio campbellii TaxID=680 RepID=UPI001F07A100|nr:hypothetical protein [Vibrio campbellii]UMM06800.1 hypothetical protein MKR81_26430 [Vibrio campbellii]
MQTTNQTTFNDTPACVLNDVFNAPMPGDFVQVVDSISSDALTGSFGVILGYKNNSKDEYDICINPYPAPWGGKVTDAQITAAGGTTIPMVGTDLLKPTSNVMIREFFTKSPFIHKVKCAVKVWTLDLCAYERSGRRQAFISNSVIQTSRSIF